MSNNNPRENRVILYTIIIIAIGFILLLLLISDNYFGNRIKSDIIIFVDNMPDGKMKNQFVGFIANNIPGIFLKPYFIAYSREFYHRVNRASEFSVILHDRTNHPTKAFIQSLTDLTSNEDYRIKSHAALYLAMTKAPESFKILVKLSKDKNVEVSSTALNGFGYLGDIRAVELLANNAINNKRVSHRLIAMETLVAILCPNNKKTHPKAMKIQPKVIKALNDKEEMVRQYALLILANHSDRSVIDRIKPLLNAKEKHIRDDAKSAIEQIKERYPLNSDSESPKH